ncbi:DUF6415 family natural product biosynthesis protein [Streptomyces sp. NPDC058405]|uniref:DUF6415 family natural product biosynthesis protein n=1 Tax=Streptomyces sp. NPDC058405 TaxID=3346482 RepID=UPI003664CB71
MHPPAIADMHHSEAHLAQEWTQVLDARGLARIAKLLRDVKPLDEILDDIGDVLADQDPPEAEFEDIAERLRAGLARLVTISGAARNDDAQVVWLIKRAHTLNFEQLPANHRQALGYLRRTAVVANDLLERLAVTNTLRHVA